MERERVGRIVSGGQTGADRAALDFAIANRIPYGGWCPRGGRAEDMPWPPGLLARYPSLRETASEAEGERTRLNVRDSDATLILTARSASGDSPGTRATERAARELGRACAVLDVLDLAAARTRFAALARAMPPSGTLNVAGPRESEAPGIYAQSRALLDVLLGEPPTRSP
jgi:Circularly permutated YpsA SLOG family